MPYTSIAVRICLLPGLIVSGIEPGGSRTHSYIVASNISAIDWSWNGFNRVAFCVGDKAEPEILLGTLDPARMECQINQSIGVGSLPVFVDAGNLVYAGEKGKLLRVTLEGSNPKSTNAASLNATSGVNAVRVIGDQLWFYAVNDDGGARLSVKMFRSGVALQDAHRLGAGYYPRPFDNESFLYSDFDREYSLRKGRIVNGSADGDPIVAEGPAYFAEVSFELGAIIFQRGSGDEGRIVSTSLNGEQERLLSTRGMSGVFPRLSPSQRLVAFGEYTRGGNAPLKLRVLKIDGTEVHSESTKNTSAMTMFRWAPSESRLAVLRQGDDAKLLLSVIDFPGR